MAISATQVKDLREKTGAAMMDCKRALEQTEGDEQKAIVILREKGLAVAQKREGKTASEGRVEAESLEAGGGQRQRVGVAGVEFPQSGIDVAADRSERRVAELCLQLRLTPHAARPDARCRTQRRHDLIQPSRGRSRRQNERVARVFARDRCGDAKSLW